MKKAKFKNYIYEDDLLRFESHIEEFTPELFEEFNKKSEELDLRSKIEDLMSGDVVNQSENQAAWHPKYRKDGAKPNDLLLNHIQQIKKVNKKDKINILIIGIGGSFEGPKLLVESLHSPLKNNEYNTQFLTGSDKTEFTHKTSSLDPENTIFIISSKSFTTNETIEMLKHAIEWMPDLNNFILITSNPFEAKKYGFDEKNIALFDKEIGGRYSIWSSIAQIPLLEEEAYKKFVKGGYHSDLNLLNNKEYLKFVKRLSFTDIWLHNNKNKNVRVVLSYIWRIRSFTDYAQQLEMESLGKRPNANSEYNKTGQIIFGGYGPIAQHSYFQLMHQGTQEICADIIACRQDNTKLSYAQAITQASLLANGADDLLDAKEKINGDVPLNLFLLNKIDSFTLGYLIATWEHRTFITAMMLGINPFDQYGVSAGKIYTKKYLSIKD